MTDPAPAPVLRRGRLLLRPTTLADVPALAAILAEPEVGRWWVGYDAARVRTDLVDDDDVITWTIEVGARGPGMPGSAPAGSMVVGAIQASEESEPDYRHAGIDLFLSAAVQGQGVGPAAIRLVAAWLIDVRGHHRLTIDPAADNAAAIRAYGKVGFAPVGTMRRYERGADGTWHDGLLMELLADELVRDE